MGDGEQDVRVDVGDGVVTVTLDRLEKRNAISQPITDALWDAVNRLRDDDDLRVMVIRAEGEYFTAGIDLHGEWTRDLYVPMNDLGMTFRRKYRRHHLLYDEFEAVEKPIVMAVQGPCLGAGTEMATSVDFRIASSAAAFALPEVRFGSVAGSGGATRLCRLVGPHWAKWISMAGQTVDAETALRIGLVHEVVEPDHLDARVDAFVADLVTIPVDGLGLSKLVIDAAVDADRVTGRHLDRLANTRLFDQPRVDAYRDGFRETAGS